MRRDAMSATPVPTFYNGYLFRSRLEARWAVFFDRLGVKYQYERETWDVDPWYLPDFYLPEQECWVEIKGPTPTAEEKRKAAALADVTRQTVYLCHGDPYGPMVYEYSPLSPDGGPHYVSILVQIAVADRYKVVASVGDLASGWRLAPGAAFRFSEVEDWWIDLGSSAIDDLDGDLWVEQMPGATAQVRSVSTGMAWCPVCNRLMMGLVSESSVVMHIAECMAIDGYNLLDEQHILVNAATVARSVRFEGKSIVYVSGVQGGRVDVARVPAYA